MNIDKRKTQLNNKKIFMLLLISLFVFPQELRSILGEKMFTINMMGIVSLVLLIINNFRGINKKKIIFLFITILVYMSTAVFYENNIMNIGTVIILFLTPLSLTIIEVDKQILKDIFKWTILILNIIIIIITVVGILEIIFNININIAISKFMSQRTQEQILLSSVSGDAKRLYSFMGHPLFNTELYLMFFVLNILYNKYFNEACCPIWILIISIIGIAFTGSKSGFVLLCLGIIVLFKCNNKIKKTLIIICGIIIAFQTGLFDTLISRFTSESLTTGRSEKWIQVQSMNIFPIKFFAGYGRGFTFKLNSYTDWASAAFEYPMRMFSLELGILITIMMYIFIMIIPIITLMKRKHYFLIVSYLIVFLDVNTFNGLSTSGDKMIIFCLFTFLILNLSNLVQVYKADK
ncbi:hypothetical protein [Clostridium sp. CM027]|nr:hypothetical protein [Clostridium sp. CM027]